MYTCTVFEYFHFPQSVFTESYLNFDIHKLKKKHVYCNNRLALVSIVMRKKNISSNDWQVIG